MSPDLPSSGLPSDRSLRNLQSWIRRCFAGLKHSGLNALVLPVCSAAILSGNVILAQERNPFAEWDRLQKETESSLNEPEPAPLKLRPRQSGSSINYFTPGGATESLATPMTSSPVPIRERLGTTREATPSKISESPNNGGVTAPGNVTIPATGAKVTAPPEDPWSNARPGLGNTRSPVAFDAAPGEPSPAARPAPDITRAGLHAQPAGGIQLTSEASAAPGDGETAPSLDEFLQRYGTNRERPVLHDDGPVPHLTLSPSGKITPPPAETPARVVAPFKSASVASAAAASPAATAVDSGAQSPGVTLKWIRRDEFNVGQECEFDLVVENTSEAQVRGVHVEAMIPSSLRVVSSDPPPEAGSAAPGWALGDMQPGEKRIVTLRAVPGQRGDLRLDASVRLTGYSSAAFSVQEPKIGVELAGPTAGAVGEQLRYNIQVSNPGTGTARNVVVQAALPEGLEHRHGSLITMDVGTLNPGETQQVFLSLTAVSGGDQLLSVRAIAEGGLSSESASNVAVAQPELDLLISGPTELLVGGTSEFEVVVVNSGKVASANVRSRYRIPQGFEFVSAERGGRLDESDQSVEFFVGSLQPGETSSLKLSLKATAAGEYTHQAGVISEHGQIKVARCDTKVDGVAELKLDIVSDSRPVKTGDTSEFQVVIRNTGSQTAEGIGISCELPPCLELVEAAGPTEHIAQNGVLVFRSVPQIAAGDSVTLTIRARGRREGSQNLRFRIASSSLAEPLIGEQSCEVVR